jgi:hypothetical protein
LSPQFRVSRRVFTTLSVTLLATGSPFLLPTGCGSSGNKGSTLTSDAGSRDGTVFASASDDSSSDAGTAGGGEGGPDDAGEAGPSVTATIKVDPAAKLGAVGPAFVGLSYEKSHLQAALFRGDNAAAVAMFDLLGPGILRVGGNSVDSTVWQTYDAGPPSPEAGAPTVITAADVDGLAAFAKAAGWQVLYGVNMKISPSGVAADEAAYASTSLGSSLYGFEIGNECDLYTSVASSPGAWTYNTFTADWNAFEAAMHAVAPTAPFTGPASANHETTWTVPFAKKEAPSIRLLTQHYYVANGQSDASTIDFLLQPHPALVTDLQELADAAASNAIADGYRLSECNSFYNGGAPNISDAFGTALWAIDFLFTNAEYGSSGVNFHGGGNGTGYTPIADQNGEVVGARPIFYGMLLFAKVGQGTVLATSGVPATINFSAYAVSSAGSTTTVVLNNKDRATTVHATVDVGATIASATAILLRGPSLDATTGVTLADAAIAPDGGFAPSPPTALPTAGKTFTIDVPPASAALVTAQ